MNPRLIINLEKLVHNANFLSQLCHKHGVSFAAVTKVFCADPQMVAALAPLNIDFLADSRLENIAAYPAVRQKTMLLRLPTPALAPDVVRLCDISLNSELSTITALAEAARSQGKTHGILLMIDLGDLREGIYHDETAQIMEICRFVLAQKGLTLEGIGTNLTCYGSVLPSAANLGRLSDIAEEIEAKFDTKLPIVSGGNSSSLNMLVEGQIPKKVNNLRLGESLVCGLETAYGQPFPSLKQNIITLETPIIEIAKKPSMPEGRTNINAFGEKIIYTDRGMHLRAIAAIGRQDTHCEGLTPLDPGVEIVGASSDHLILDITRAKSPKIGDPLRFSLSYGAVLAGFTSKYVDKFYEAAL
ncbi:MAG: alanine/ornithine racemase family PLP-dependent enzyme [Clostridiales bacterium]|jgi:predicted amino acid racemase|nr:alanine/ornithine racemase family PLP-dependent enzyme [Clostridiales bacterium]